VAEISDEYALRLLAACEDWAKATREPLHERDCGPCDLAAEIAGSIGAVWDNDETWDDTPATNGESGDSKLDQLTRIIAWVLHRKLAGAVQRGGGTRANGDIPRKLEQKRNRLPGHYGGSS
jgi:hypothetical protein